MPIPDICLMGSDDNLSVGGIGQAEGVGGGVGSAGSVTVEDGVSYAGTIGDKPCNRPVISATTDMKRRYNIQLKRPNGTVLDLTNIAKVMFYAKETNDAVSFYISKECSITDAANGMISLRLRGTDVPYSGVWLAAFHLLDASNAPVAQFDVYLYVEKSLTSANTKNNTITIPEVRMALLDRCPGDNSLLDDIEFTDAEIAFAIRRPVDEWNEHPPMLYNATYTTATFPFRYNWIDAACSELLRMASRKLLRNKLDYQAGGVQVKDKSRAEIYLQLAEQMHQRWKEWLIHHKAAVNAGNIYGGVKTLIYY
jgi:hypothetical protein